MESLNPDGNPLQGHTALVTGAGRGLGRALALQLGAAGARVVGVARSATTLEDLVDEARGPVETIVADLADRDDLLALGAALRARGDVSLLVNNAAVVEPLGRSWDIEPGAISQAYDVNTIAPAALAAAVIPGMIAAGGGRIVNVSSRVVATPAGMLGGNTYVATKSALEAHTANLAAELAAAGHESITVHTYRPGIVDTGMQEWVRSQDPSRIGPQLHVRFTAYRDDGLLLSADESAAGLTRRLIEAEVSGGAFAESGRVWSVED